MKETRNAIVCTSFPEDLFVPVHTRSLSIPVLLLSISFRLASSES